MEVGAVVEQSFMDHLATEVNTIGVDLNTNTLNLVKVIAHIQK